jgi:hypothetical protein
MAVRRSSITVRRPLSIFALIGFFSSLFVHLTTFFGIDPSKHVPWVWVLHVGIFVAFIPMVLVQGWAPKKDFWNKLFASMPRWAGYAIKAFFAYAVINFVLFLVLSRGGVPEVRDGKYVLQGKGWVQELSENEYEWQNAYTVRGFSGHWMIFYLVSALVLWYRPESTLHTPRDSGQPRRSV